MNCAVIENAKQITPELFGDTNIAGGIPEGYEPCPSNGPVYFEGKLILALSFQCGKEVASESVQKGEETANEVPDLGCLSEMPGQVHTDKAANSQCTIYDRLRLWNNITNTWFDPSPEIIRLSNHDVVFVAGSPVYSGIVNNMREIALVPGWDSACTSLNSMFYLRWKSCAC